VSLLYGIGSTLAAAAGVIWVDGRAPAAILGLVPAMALGLWSLVRWSEA
jgi:hypothetical protein